MLKWRHFSSGYKTHFLYSFAYAIENFRPMSNFLLCTQKQIFQQHNLRQACLLPKHWNGWYICMYLIWYSYLWLICKAPTNRNRKTLCWSSNPYLLATCTPPVSFPLLPQHSPCSHPGSWNHYFLQLSSCVLSLPFIS